MKWNVSYITNTTAEYYLKL